MRTILHIIIFSFLTTGFISQIQAAEVIPGVPLRGFSDFSWKYNSDNSPNAFVIGPLDLFLTKPIDKNVTFLSEIVFEIKNGNLVTDLERLIVQYKVNDWFKVGMGRYHTALGYWNETYHHGTYLHTTIVRPRMFRFEDNSGLLPVHSIGMELRGNGQVGSSNLGYIMNVGNGRGVNADPPQMTTDSNFAKSFSVVVYYEMENGLRVGGTGYFDALPTGEKQSSDPTPGGRETIYGGHIVFTRPEFDLLAEYLNMQHFYNNGLATDTMSHLFYGQLGVHIGLLTPYFRYEINTFNANDEYFRTAGNASGFLASSTAFYTLGARYEISDASAVKAEYVNQAPGTNNTVTLNWSFGW